MQYELQTPRRTSTPVSCPTCGAAVTAAMETCAVCGGARDAANFNATLDLGRSPEEPLPNEALHAFESAPSNRLLPPRAARSCTRCNAKLGPDWKFCRSCGVAVGAKVHPRSEPPRENVVPMRQPVPTPEPEPAPQGARPPGRHISLTYLDDELGEDLPPPSKSADMDYLDAVLGQKAPGSESAPPKPATWRLWRHRVPAEKARDLPPEDPGVAGAVSPDPHTRQPSDTPSLAVPGAIGFALVALGIAVLVHLFAPNAPPGYSAAEFELNMRMRAVEWLLAGILIALVGLLFKR